MPPISAKESRRYALEHCTFIAKHLRTKTTRDATTLPGAEVLSSIVILEWLSHNYRKKSRRFVAHATLELLKGHITPGLVRRASDKAHRDIMHRKAVHLLRAIRFAHRRTVPCYKLLKEIEKNR